MDTFIQKNNPLLDNEFQESRIDDWGEWECPNCQTTWEDPNSVSQTSCGVCNQIVKLSWTDNKGYREAIADGFLNV